jgi:serine/threonine protein kinase
MSFHVGQTFGDYSILAVLGSGGMERVYTVEHRLTKRTEAMKVLSAEFATDVEIQRFEREMRALARLSHPHIAALYNAVHSGNELILLMEYIEGQTLESLFSAGRLPTLTGIEYIRQILSALGYAHQQGIVHRDVTPANVMVSAAGVVKLTDFGLSKSYGDPLLTNCGEVLGSLPYAAPERLKGATQPNRRSDLYSVGAILYEHLTGQKPFGANRRLAPVLTDSEPDPEPPSQLQSGLSPQWDVILRRALARDPAHRYQSAEEFLGAMARLDQPPVADLPLPQLRTLGWGTAIFAGLVLALVASPALHKLRQAAPAITLPRGLHIAPPAAAFVQTPHIARRERVRHGRQAAPAVDARGPDEQLLTAPVAASAPVVPASSAESQAQNVTQPVAPDVPESTESPDATPAKKGFWSKLNVFKKRGADAKDKP